MTTFVEVGAWLAQYGLAMSALSFRGTFIVTVAGGGGKVWRGKAPTLAGALADAYAKWKADR